MNTYARGNRDGLLNLAAELERRADDEDASAERIRRSPGYRLTRGTVSSLEHSEVRRVAYRDAAALARRRAEACPEDPEVGE